MLRRAFHRLRFIRDHDWVPPHASAYLDGELRPRALARVQRHREECLECRELLRSLQAVLGALGAMRGAPSEPVADVVLASVKSRLGNGPPGPR